MSSIVDSLPGSSLDVSNPPPAMLETRPRSKSLPGRRKVIWKDDAGQQLCQAMLFRKTDEAWRCNPNKESSPLSLSLNRGSPSLKRASYRQIHTHRRMIFRDSALPKDQSSMDSALAGSGVKLESVCVREPLIFLTVRVLNIAFHKHVFVRVTDNHWHSHRDYPCAYLPGVASPHSDRFHVTIPVNDSQTDQLQFALCYEASGKQYWDNNNGDNYEIQIQRKTNHHRFGRTDSF